MALSPRAGGAGGATGGVTDDNTFLIGGIPTIPTQINFYSGTTESMKSDSSCQDEIQDNID